ncbi:GNS1/SUR4 family-domain-containing protein [Chytriomyces sp. MP71]|nr:GNS1/SUR4 family-domain-containing protein [Chytriomyces sp. MP71]
MAAVLLPLSNTHFPASVTPSDFNIDVDADPLLCTFKESFRDKNESSLMCEGDGEGGYTQSVTHRSCSDEASQEDCVNEITERDQLIHEMRTVERVLEPPVTYSLSFPSLPSPCLSHSASSPYVSTSSLLLASATPPLAISLEFDGSHYAFVFSNTAIDDDVFNICEESLPWCPLIDFVLQLKDSFEVTDDLLIELPQLALSLNEESVFCEIYSLAHFMALWDALRTSQELKAYEPLHLGQQHAIIKVIISCIRVCLWAVTGGMELNGVMAAASERIIALRILETYPEDTFINLCNLAAEFLDPMTSPITAQLSTYVPASLEAIMDTVHTPKLPFMNPVHVALTIACYLAIIVAGTTVMRSLPRFEIKTFALCHNLFLTSLSAYMCFKLCMEAWRNNYRVLGNPVDDSPNGWPMAKLVWLFYESKVTEFVDTISFLHLYHHASVLAVWWFVIYVGPGGEAWFSAALNSFIHVVMYGYYFLSALGFKQVSFIKKYITMMQMTQFCCMMVQAIGVGFAYPFYARLLGLEKTDFVYPSVCGKILLLYMISMLSLFANFYVQDRKRERASKEVAKQDRKKGVK